MLSKPQNGWTNITIGNWTDRASYLTNVHLDLLTASINILKTGLPQCIFCDAEGWDYIIVFEENAIHIISNKDTYEYFTYDFFEENTHLKDILLQLYKDVEDNLSDWMFWDPCVDLNDIQDVENQEKEIKERLKSLKELLKKEGI